MRLLLDECVPHPLKQDFRSHDVHTVGDMGWSSKRNSELLSLMVADGFECLLTVDQNLSFQQNLAASGIAVVVMVAKTNRLKELGPLVPRALLALANISPGEVLRVSGN